MHFTLVYENVLWLVYGFWLPLTVLVNPLIIALPFPWGSCTSWSIRTRFLETTRLIHLMQRYVVLLNQLRLSSKRLTGGTNLLTWVENVKHANQHRNVTVYDCSTKVPYCWRYKTECNKKSKTIDYVQLITTCRVSFRAYSTTISTWLFLKVSAPLL